MVPALSFGFLLFLQKSQAINGRLTKKEVIVFNFVFVNLFEKTRRTIFFRRKNLFLDVTKKNETQRPRQRKPTSS
jgi:hypothetical protein